jgi:hypothetical protein
MTLSSKGSCDHPKERLSKTFGMRTLRWCEDCGRQVCHLCLVVHDRDVPCAVIVDGELFDRSGKSLARPRERG